MTTIWVLLVSGNIIVGDAPAFYAAYRTYSSCNRARAELSGAVVRCDKVRISQQ